MTPKGAEIANLELFKRNFPLALRDHDQKLVALRFFLEDMGVAKSWIAEHEIRSKIDKKYGLRSMKQRLIPDALVGVSMKGVMTSVALELELNLKNKSRYFKTFNLYGQKSEIKFIWYVVSHKSHVRILFRYFNDYKFLTDGKTLLISVFDDLMAGGLDSVIYTPKLVNLSEVMVAASSAHRVSTLSNSKIELQNLVTTENAAPILEKAG